MKKMLRMAAAARNVLVCCLLSCCLLGCGGGRPTGGSALERIRARGELTWGADEQGGEPYVFEDAARGGALVGFEVDLADALARALGVRARFVQNDWTTLIPSLERGTFDVAFNGIEVTPALAARVAFSRPYYLFSERLVARRGDARVRDLASTAGLRVGTLAGSLAWQLAKDAGADAVPYEGVDEPFVDLAHGRIDAVLLDDIIVARYAGRHPTLAVVADVADGSYAIAFRPQDEDLRQAINRAFGAELASGAWRQTLARWQIDGPRQAALAVAPDAAAAVQVGTASLSPRQLALFLEGALVTLLISLAAMALAAPLGLALALVRLESRRLRPFAAAYVEIVRGTPVLLQLYILYYGLADVVALGPWSAAIIGLGLNYAAYEAEIYRGAIQVIPDNEQDFRQIRVNRRWATVLAVAAILLSVGVALVIGALRTEVPPANSPVPVPTTSPASLPSSIPEGSLSAGTYEATPFAEEATICVPSQSGCIDPVGAESIRFTFTVPAGDRCD
jgi:polar amino acid transport system substrate-binding protein